MRGLPPQIPPATPVNALQSAEAFARHCRSEFGDVQVAAGYGSDVIAETRPCVVALGQLERACKQAAALADDHRRDAIPRQEHMQRVTDMLSRIRPRIANPPYVIGRLLSETTRTILAAAHCGIEGECGGREVLATLATTLEACQDWLPQRYMPLLEPDDWTRLERARGTDAEPKQPKRRRTPKPRRASGRPPTKGLWIRIPRPLHARAVAACTRRQQTVSSALATLLHERFPPSIMGSA